MLGLARRLPSASWPKAEFAAVDVADPDADLAGCLRGADTLVHLAWAIQPVRDERAMWRTNVEGTAALLLKGDAASEVLRLFLGPFVPPIVLGRRLLPLFPHSARLRFQVAHSLDAGVAFTRAAVRPVRGAFNLAAEPLLDAAALARILHARPVPVPASLLRAAASMSWRIRLQPTDPGWVDLVLSVPLMETGRARQELGWEPRYDAADAVTEILDGFRERAGTETAPLEPVG